MTTADKTNIDRAALVGALALVKPAIATQAYIPALTHIRFAGGWATAYNDVSAIMVMASVDFDRCIPGDMLIRTLGSFSGDQVSITGNQDAVVVSSGRSKIKMPTLAAADFPFKLPEDDAPAVDMIAEMRTAIARCLISVGTNDKHPAQMGVTLEADARGNAVLYSTDNYTISRCATKARVSLPGGSPIIMPTFFCEQLLALSKAFPDAAPVMYALPGALLAEFLIGDDHIAARLFTRTIVDLEPMDFPKIVARHCDLAAVRESMAPIPDAFDAALARALLVLGGEADKRMMVTLQEAGLVLQSECPMGHSDDRLRYEPAGDGTTWEPFYVDPGLVARASKVCSLIGFLSRAVILADGDATFVHLVAHSAPAKKKA